MAGKDIIMASQRELKRLHIVQKVIEGTLKQAEAAEMLSLSIRQTGRIVIRVKEGGPQWIVHRSRGRESNRKITQKTCIERSPYCQKLNEIKSELSCLEIHF